MCSCVIKQLASYLWMNIEFSSNSYTDSCCFSGCKITTLQVERKEMMIVFSVDHKNVIYKCKVDNAKLNKCK